MCSVNNVWHFHCPLLLNMITLLDKTNATFPLVFFSSFSHFLSVSFASQCFLLLNICFNISVTQGSFLSPFPSPSSNSPWAIAYGGFTYHLYTNNPNTCISDKPHLFSSVMFELALVENWNEWQRNRAQYLDPVELPVETGDCYLILAAICFIWETLDFLDFAKWVDRKVIGKRNWWYGQQHSASGGFTWIRKENL